MPISRRDLLRTGAAALGASVVLPRGAGAIPAIWTDPQASPPEAPAITRTAPADGAYTPVITPNGASLPWKKVGGYKVYHLVAEEVLHEFAPGLQAYCWGYNGRVHGPTIEAVEGDKIRIYVTNNLQVSTTVHWHGVFLPNGMDGVGGLNQPVIKPGETFRYEFEARQNGTFMYHSHHDEMTQIGMGMVGMFVIHPRRDPSPPDRDFAIMLHEWRVDPGTARPNPMEMSDFNVLTMNAKAFPGTEALVCKRGERVRIRFGNLSPMDHHPIHLHGHYWRTTATDGGPIAATAQLPETTVLVPVGTTRTVEFIATDPGDWAMHCHMTHHVMNQMGHGAPNMVGVDAAALDAKAQPLLPGYMTMGHVGGDDMGAHVEMGHMAVPENSIPMVGAMGPFDYITMGGMYTNVKIREGITSYEDPGWYEHPPGTVAHRVDAATAAADGITLS